MYVRPSNMTIKSIVSTNFRLELTEPYAIEVFILWTLVEREELRGGRVRRGEEDMAQT